MPTAVAVDALLARAATGDERAWKDLVDAFAAPVWAAARGLSLSHADACDVSQTTWLRLVEHATRLRDPSALGAWLSTTARREGLRTLKDSSKRIPCGDDLPELQASAGGSDTQVIANERCAAVRRAFARLRARDRHLLSMLIVEPEMSYARIGALLGIPIGSIGPTRARCLERLRREIEREGVL